VILEEFNHLIAVESQQPLEHDGENGVEHLIFFVEGKGVKDEKQMKALLLHCGGMELQDVYLTLPGPLEPGRARQL